MKLLRLSLLPLLVACSEDVDGKDRDPDIVGDGANTAPTCAIDAPSEGATAAPGEAVSFEATVGDAEQSADELLVAWSSDIDGDLRESTALPDGSVVFTTGDLSVGTHRITLLVEDAAGERCGDGVSVTVDDVAGALAVTLSPDPAITTDDLAATVSGADAGATLAFAWTEDGVALAETGRTLPASETTKGGTYAVTVTPDEGDPATAALTVSNADPTLAGPTLDRSTVQVSDVVTCAASASDVDPADSPVVAYAWHDGSAGATYTVTADDDPGDAVTCTATADDGDGGGATASASATVTNSDPGAVSVSVAPAAPRVGDTVTCTGTATDPDGDTPTLAYAWQDGSTGATYTVAATDDPGDTLTCTATASDAHGGSATGTGTVTVANTDPALSAVSISPSAATNDDTLTCSATATDADGGTPTVAYAWSGSSAGSLGAGATLDLAATTAASAETITCTATATDADGGAASDTVDLTLSNRDPSVSMALSPGSGATAADTLTCTATTADEDGDTTTTTFTWTVDGVTTAATTTAAEESTLAGAFSRGDTVACSVATSDSKGGAATDSASVTITNTPPSTPTVTITPASPTPSDDLACAATTATDADGDALTTTLTWWQSGTEVTALAGSSTVASSYTSGGDTWTCDVEVTDGTDTVSADAEVEICSVITIYRDADGDGHGTSATSSTSCASAIPSGYVDNADDCDDSDADISPDAEELCATGVDEDCDGATDEDDTDADGDGWRICDGDCDDADQLVNPGVVEVCDNGVDDDCDGATDTADQDGDGYDGCGGTDCNDLAAWVNPGESEDLDDGLDNDCDGTVDSDTVDDDGDGYTEAAGDCDDARPWVFPGAFDIPDSGTDEDCSGGDAALSDLALPLHVDATYGSDSFCSGLSTCPYQTIGAALAAAGTGNVLVVAEGTYAEDVSADWPIVGGYDSAWAAGADAPTIDGDLTFPTATGVDRAVSRVTITGTVTFSGSASALLHDATIEAGTSTAVTTDTGIAVLAGVVAYGPSVASGGATTVDVGAGGVEIHDSVLFGGVGADASSGGGAGGDATTVASAVGASVRIRGTALLGGFGGAGQTGSTGSAAYIYYSSGSRRLRCNTAGGTGGAGGDIVLVEEGTVLGSWLSNGVPGDGGTGGTGGAGFWCTYCSERIKSEDGGRGGRGGAWVAMSDVVEVAGSTIAAGRTDGHAGAGGGLGSGYSGTPNRCNLGPSVGDTGPVSTYLGLALASSGAAASWTNVSLGSPSQEGDTTCFSDTVGADVSYSTCDAGSANTATGLESTASGTALLSSLLLVDGGAGSWVAWLDGSAAALLSNTLVGASDADGVYVGGAAMAFANTISRTDTGATCVYDDAGSFDLFANNLFTGCTSQIVYDATAGAYRPNIATVNAITATTASGSNLWADPLFAGSGSYAVSSSSPAVDAGYDLSTLGVYPEQDLDRVTRSVGSGWDIGAYEQ